MSLALLVAGLSLFIWYAERDLPSSDDRAEMAKQVLPWEADDVHEVRILRDGVVTVLARPPLVESEEGDEDGTTATRTWQVTAPLRAKADAARVDGLVQALVGLEKERTLGGDEGAEIDPVGLGLDEPRAEIRLVSAEGEARILIGGQVPASSSMVVSRASHPDRAYVVADGLWSDLQKDPGDWRSRDVVTTGRFDMERLSLERQGESLLLARRGQDFWMEAPVVDRADRNLVNDLLSTVEGLEVREFLDPPDVPAASDLGLEPARAVLEIVLKGRERPLRVELGDELEAEPETETEASSRMYARLGEQVFEITTELNEHLQRPLKEWRSKRWTSMETYEVDVVRLADGLVGDEGESTLKRGSGDWLRDGEPIDYQTVSDLISELTSQQAEDVLALESLSDPGEALLSIVLAGDEEDAESETLSLYAAHEVDGGLEPARVSDREAWLMLPVGTAKSLTELVRAIHDAEVVVEEEESLEDFESSP